ncbi:hypothetical protein BH23GEM9_BH23GEM9_11150 [soil metagenome]
MFAAQRSVSELLSACPWLAVLLAGMPVEPCTTGFAQLRVAHCVIETEPISRQPVCARAAYPAGDVWFGSDKATHLGVSFGAASLAFGAARGTGMSQRSALATAMALAAAAGVGKEVHDLRSGGIFSKRDLVADGVGLAAAYFLLREIR